MLYAEVAVRSEAPYRHSFTYSVPQGLALVPGQGVLVPFGRRTLQGVVLSIDHASRFEGEVRPILGVAAELPLVLPHLIELARWMSSRYLAPLSSCVSLLLPPGVERRTKSRLLPLDGEPATDDQRAIIDALRADPSADLVKIQERLALSRVSGTVESLIRRGLLRREYYLDPPSVGPRLERRLSLTGQPSTESDAQPLVGRLLEAGGSLPISALRRVPEWTESTMRELLDLGIAEQVEARVDRDPLAGQEFPIERAPRLTPRQAAAVREILRSNGSSVPQRAAATLLHGVTGSGKTEVYLATTASVLAAGKRALVLVPEIALTPQTIQRFGGRFPGRVAVLHSGLSAGQRYDQWCGVREGRFDVVVGSRSALFAPIESLGLIVVDEEHEWTYKQQDQQPRYQARDVAARLAQLTGAALVFGSATPDVVSYHRALAARYRHVELPDRVRPERDRAAAHTEALPTVEVVDLARELREGNRSIFSRSLGDALAETLARSEQSILFLNRRGSASFVLCRDCGHVPHCSRCAVTLTYHADAERLVCHQCGRARRAPAVCPRCRGTRIRYLGLGTQRVEEEVARRFPQARTIRWDSDSANTASEHAGIYARIQRGEADILIGTQMVTSGLDLPLVTLVGVVNADTALNAPDYLSGEHAFQILTQVAGRAGRRDRPGRVILQTYAPNHYAIRSAAMHDYRAFYRQEIEFRRRGVYPPFSRLTRLVYANGSSEHAAAEARRIASTLRAAVAEGQTSVAEVVGPTPCQTARLRGRWRWQILIRSPRPAELLENLQLPAGWSIDIDPQSFL